MIIQLDLKKELDTPFGMAQHHLRTACEAIGADQSVYERFKEPARVTTVNLPVKMDSGEWRSFVGYRSQHTNVLGPTKGGIRFHPGVTLGEVKALSMWMTFKCSLLALPLGGGKGGVIVDPHELSESELERLSRQYIRSIVDVVGPDKDIPAPDVYTDARVMGWMMDEYSQMTGRTTPGMITGKPIILGGSLGRNEATARGCFFTIREAAKRLGIELNGATAVVQGYGNAGSIVAGFLHEVGAKVTCVSDSRGAVCSPDGLDPSAVLEHKARTGSVSGFPGSQEIDPAEVLFQQCDILVPAALEGVITGENADRLQTKIVAEAANGPTTPEADEILHQKGIYVIPDILANAGGVTVSYFEWAQNLTSAVWSEDEVNRRLEEKMVAAFDRVHSVYEERAVAPRLASYIVSLEHIVDAARARGWIPRA